MRGDAVNLKDDRPLVALTMGDVAGVGPEVIARAWGDSPLRTLARPFVVGSRAVLERALACMNVRAVVQEIARPEDAAPSARSIPCLEATAEDVSSVAPGRVDPRAGRAAFDYLITAVDLALAGRIDAITTLPLNKEALNAGGVNHPGHTEILAERCGVTDHAMMLYVAPPLGAADAGARRGSCDLASSRLRRIFDLLTVEAVELENRAGRTRMHASLWREESNAPRRGRGRGSNPARGRGGTLRGRGATDHRPGRGQEHAELGSDVTGPIAADTLFVRAIMPASSTPWSRCSHHDQGHVAAPRPSDSIAHGEHHAGHLPIIRTSVAHGTAYDIAWRGTAETSSLIEAVRVAARIVAGRRRESQAIPAR